MSQIENVIIVGSGPAGYTAALYTSRANLKPLRHRGLAVGRAAAADDRRRELPRLPAGRSWAPSSCSRCATRPSASARASSPTLRRSVELATEPGGVHRVWVGDDVHETRTVILAMGAEHKKIGAPGEEELGGRGVSYCATCDAAFFAAKDTLIVGGGDSAMEEAIFLSKFASKVTIVNRRDEFRASKIMLERARGIDEHRVAHAVRRRGVRAPARTARCTPRSSSNVETGETREVPVDGAFIAIGHEPQSEILAGQVTARRRGLRPASRGARRAPASRASSPPATSSTTPTARPSRRPAPAARRRSTPSGTCATHRRFRRRRASRTPATSPRRSTRRCSTPRAERRAPLRPG